MYKVCTVCQRPLVQKPGGTRKDGTTWKPFMGCEVWDDAHKRARDAYKQAKGQPNTSPNRITAPTTQPNGIRDAFLLEEIQGFRKETNERLDALGQYLSKKLG